MDLSVSAGKEFAGLVRYVDFGVESAAGEVDGVGGSNNFAFETAAGILHEFERGGEACTNVGRVDFGDANVGTNRIGLRKIEESLSGAAVSGVDQISGIDVALCDYAAKRRVDVLEGFEFFE